MDNLDMIARTNGMGVTELRETAGDIRLEEINWGISDSVRHEGQRKKKKKDLKYRKIEDETTDKQSDYLFKL